MTTANAIRVNAQLVINNGNCQYANRPGTFTADMDGTGGPTPGFILASKYGTVVDLSQITKPGGLCCIENIDASASLLWGPYDLDGTVGDFIPVGMLLAGETTVFRLAPDIGSELGTGSGTVVLSSGITLMVKGLHSACQCRVSAFDA